MKNQAQQFKDTRLVAITLGMAKDALLAFAEHNPTATLQQLVDAITIQPESVVTHLDTLVADAARYRYLRSTAITNGDAETGQHLSTPEFDTHIDQRMAAEHKTVVPFPRKR